MHFHCAMMCALCLLLGFLPLEIQSRPLTLQSLARSRRLSLHTASKYPKSFHTTTRPSAADPPVVISNVVTRGGTHIIRKARLHKQAPQKSTDPMLDHSDSVIVDPQARQRGSRGRRHANSKGWRGHGHLMRVGCVLGTCQVQNLSHRLYQLIGQGGREDSSPINPRSPHSYG